ncbi:hypothetical protein RND71_042551 [Anisodus tanguticus]|uniref:Uncharacterized protein n=1 Tax=Anisodus tanguticus TaxID=243964 RepID=A0AAE1UUX1_9SOLA|nr:hypothetical protein RND71_042551 [Anisodus tanguticus]
MSSVPKMNDDVLAQENQVVVVDDANEMFERDGGGKPNEQEETLTITQNTLYKWGSSSISMHHLKHSDGENAHSVRVEQESKSSTSRASFSSVDNSTTKPSIN